MENSVIDREREKVETKPKSTENEFIYTPPPPPPRPPAGSNLELNEFLNPRSMITPGIAGSLVMLIANTLWVQFMIPQKWSAIALSYLLIVPVLIRFSAAIFESIIYFIFNGLIVFALAVNSNYVGSKLQQISGVVVQASADNQQVNIALKNLNDGATTVTDQKIKQTKLALNDDQSIQQLRFASNSQSSDDTRDSSDSDKDKEKKKHQKNKDEQNKDDRKFFQKWF